MTELMNDTAWYNQNEKKDHRIGMSCRVDDKKDAKNGDHSIVFVDGLKAKVDGQEDIVDLIITDLNPRTLNEYFWVILGYLYGSTSAILSNIRALIRST